MDRRRRLVDGARSTSTSRPMSARSHGSRSSASTPTRSGSGKVTPTLRRKNSIGTSTPHRRRSTSESAPTTPPDRVGQLIQEANEIAQILQKDYVFSKVDANITDEDAVRIKVANTKLHIYCEWPMSKFKERLKKMRRLMYQSETSIISDEVYYDPSDTWTKEGSNNILTNGELVSSLKDKLLGSDKPKVKSSEVNHSNNLEEYPVKDTGLQKPRSRSFHGSGSVELPAESQFIMSGLSTPTTPAKESGSFLASTPANGKEPFLPEKYLRGHHSPPERDTSTTHSKQIGQSPPPRNTKVFSQVTSTHTPHLQPSPLKLSLKPAAPLKPKIMQPWAFCSKAVSLTLSRIKDSQSQYGLADNVLRDCEALKLAVVNVLDKVLQTQEGSQKQDSVELEAHHITSIQLVSSLELLITHTAIWSHKLSDALESELVNSLTTSIRTTIISVSTELISFLKGCDEKNEATIQDSATKLLDLLYDLGKYCGELAIATETPLLSLKDTDSSVQIEDLLKISEDNGDLLHSRPGSDMKQACLTGTDHYVDKTLASALRGITECESQIEHTANTYKKNPKTALDLMTSTGDLVATARTLVVRCQEVQRETDSCMKDVEGEKPTNFFHHLYTRCRGVVTHIGALADSVSYLTQVVQQLSQAVDEGSLKKLCRCADMVKKAACKLAGLPGDFSYSGNGMDLKLIMQGMSILSDQQRHLLESAAHNTKGAAECLVNLSQKVLTTLDPSDQQQRMRRMLPVTPGGSVVRRPARSQSARLTSNRRSLPASVSAILDDQGFKGALN